MICDKLGSISPRIFHHPSMLNKNDIQVLRGMFRENNEQLKREIRDEMHSVVKASEAAMIRRMDALEYDVQKDIQTTRDDIIDVINDGILLQLEEHDREIRSIKHHLTLA